MSRILIVDDEADIVEFLAEELQSIGWQVGKAYDGVEAVLEVLDGDWDALLLDIRMPNLNGINALKIVRRIAPDLPVVMFTGYAGQGEMYESVCLGAYTCLLKPIDIERLVATLEECLTAQTEQVTASPESVKNRVRQLVPA